LLSLLKKGKGITYERAVILSWIAKHGTCPVTREPISSELLIPNRALKDAIENWRERKLQTAAAEERASADLNRAVAKLKHCEVELRTLSENQKREHQDKSAQLLKKDVEIAQMKAMKQPEKEAQKSKVSPLPVRAVEQCEKEKA
jgi:hypothetical protein